MSSIRSEVIRVFNEMFAGSKKISQLPALPSNVQNTDSFETVRDGVNYRATGSQLPSGGGGASGIGSTTVSTASGTVTLPFDSNAIMVFKAVPAIDSPKVIAVTGDGNQLTYDFIVPITDVAGTLEFGAGVEFSGNDPRWDAVAEIWTADGEGTFWFRAVWDSNGATWFVKVVESFYS